MEGRLSFDSLRQRLHPIGDSSVNLWEMVADFRENRLVPAPHQREFVWEVAKSKDYARRWQEERDPIGVFATYQLNDTGDLTLYLNDGLQRLSTCVDMLKDPVKYEFAHATQVENLFRAIVVTRQHRRYNNLAEAWRDFQDINRGTVPTAREYYRGFLTNLPDWKVVWESRYEQLINIVKSSLLRLRTKPSKSRPTIHKQERHSVSLFYRLVTDEKALKSYPIAQTNYSSHVPDSIAIEFLMATYFKTAHPSQVDSALKRFETLVASEIEMFRWTFDEELKMTRYPFNETVARWLLDAAIWRRNNEIPIEPWKIFLAKFLQRCEGSVVFPNFKDGRRTTVCGLSRIKDFELYSKGLGCDVHEVDKWKRKSRNTRNTPPGMHISHVHPIATHGESDDVFLEPAMLNLQRGDKDVSDDR
jgi:hypothetical protein